MSSITKVRKLWKEHLAIPFPEECGTEVSGIDLMTLDTISAGCISTFLDGKGNPDLQRTSIPGICYRDLTFVTGRFDGKGKEYFSRLEQLAGLVLREVRDRNQNN